MFTKTLIVLSTAVALATAFEATAQAQTSPNMRTQTPVSPKGVKPFTEFERMWFQLVEGGRD